MNLKFKNFRKKLKESKHDVTFKNKQNLENISKFKTCAQDLPIIKFKIFSFIFFYYWVEEN